MIAIIEASRAGLLARRYWLQNIGAGLIVGVVALPLAMAFAIASGAKPEQGLYTAIVAGVCVSLFGGSRVQIAGPTGAFIVILANITAQYGIDGLQIATLMAGIALLLLGVARLGGVVKFIPAPVVVGFTSGIAVVIWVGQWQDFFGLPHIQAAHFHQKLWLTLQALPSLHLATTLLAALALAITIFSPKIAFVKRIPGPLIALLVITAAQFIFKFDGVATIGTAFGDIPRGIPLPHLPHLTLSRVIELTGPAFTIMMLGAIESLLSAVIADGMANTRHDSNQELVGQGIANILSPLFGGFAATGAIARTATNIRNGGTSPIAGIVHAGVLILIVMFLAPYAAYVPLAALAAILFVVAWNMGEARHFIRMLKRAPQADVVILLVTFSLTVFVDLVVAVNIGVILATLHFLRRMSGSVDVYPQSESDLRHELAADFGATLPKHVLVYAVEGPIFFGAAEKFERVLSETHTDPRVLVIRLNRVPFADITAIDTLEEVITDLRSRNVKVILAEPNERVREKLTRAGIVDLVGVDHVCATLSQALDVARFGEPIATKVAP